ncbi:ferric-chelate reductase 1 [Aplysia californica]|uniref:Ferric-chelate reductase 1 n=1 Tax=Aplysia californica TaxID=6500 RepID=A0ABM1A103_APLCA|nr:ferric-chelate reductase 1 [Aplysia californica]
MEHPVFLRPQFYIQVLNPSQGVSLPCWLSVWLMAMSPGTMAFSGGAPSRACSDMMPQHGGRTPQTGPPPYRVTFAPTNALPGKNIEVTISGGKFKGFFIRARQGSRFLTNGKFTANMGTKLQCEGSGITHTTSVSRSAIKVIWTVPQNLSTEPYYFVATVVEQFKNFWTFIHSTNGNTTDRSPPNRDPTPVVKNGNQGTPVLLPTKDDDRFGNETIDTPGGENGGDQMGLEPHQKGLGSDELGSDPGCGRTKGCFTNCQTSDVCTYSISWVPGNNTVSFKFIYLMGGQTDQWIAIGLSHDTVMGDDNVLECVSDGDRVFIRTSYNRDKINEYPDDKTAALSEMKGSVVDDILTCSFQRQNKYPREARVFDLHTPYYLFVAFGEALAGGNKFPHSYIELPHVSSKKISFLSVNEVTKGTYSYYNILVKAHGSIMIVAWIIFANSGTFVARRGRSLLAGVKPGGKDAWFQVHRFTMSMTAFLTVVGFIIIVVHSQGHLLIPQGDGYYYRMLHSPLGLLLLVLTLVNASMATFRPEPSSSNRLMFKWTHWGLGIFSYILSLPVVAIGLDLPQSQTRLESLYILGIFVCYVLVMEATIRGFPYIVSTVWICCTTPNCCSKTNSYDLSNPYITTNEVALNTETITSMIRKGQNNIIEGARSFLLIFHIMAVVGFGVAILYFFLF